MPVDKEVGQFHKSDFDKVSDCFCSVGRILGIEIGFKIVLNMPKSASVESWRGILWSIL